MVDFLTLGFLQRSLMAAALTGGVCAAIGVFVVLRGLAFIGAGTAHAAFAGVALAYVLKLTAGLATVVVGLLALFAKEFFFLAFDQEMAEASGVPARRFFFLLLTLVALTIVVSLKTVGAILVFALTVLSKTTIV